MTTQTLGNVLLVAALASGAGCLRDTTYKCGSNEQCGTSGVCEITGYCSFDDSMCTGGRRYGEYSGIYANKCVGEVIGGEDGGIDSPPDDGSMTDVPQGNCPATYMAVSGQTNRYRVLSTGAGWTAQNNLCNADMGTTYLAVPGDQAELTAILGLAGANAWVGINDAPPGTEGTFVTSNGGSFSSSSPLWDGPEPDNDPEAGGGNNNGDCVAGFTNNDRLSDDRCDNAYVAVCECEP